MSVRFHIRISLAGYIAVRCVCFSIERAYTRDNFFCLLVEKRSTVQTVGSRVCRWLHEKFSKFVDDSEEF